MRKRILKILQIKIILITGVFLAFMFALQLPWVKNYTTKKMVHELETLTESKISVGFTSGILPLSFDLHQIDFKNKGKTWLTIEKLALNRSLLYFIFSKRKTLNLTVDKATLYSLPEFTQSKKSTTFNWPKLPFASFNMQLSAVDFNIKDNVFNQKIPNDLLIDLRFNSAKYGKTFALKTTVESKELKDVYAKLGLKGFEKQNRLHASLEFKDPKNELGPFYLSTNFPSFESQINISGSPDAMLAFLNPDIQTDQTFGGSFLISAYPTNLDNDVLSCLLNKKNLSIDSEFKFENNEGLLLKHVDIKGAEILFNGQIALNRNYQLDHSYLEGEVSCLHFTKEFFNQALEGKVRGYFSFLGDYKNPKVNAELASDMISYKEFVAYQLKSTIEYEHKQKNHLGKFTLNTDLNQSPLNITTNCNFQNINYFDLSDFSLNYGNNKLTTSLIKKRKEIYQSTLDFNLEHLAILSPFYKKEIHGDVSGQAILDIDIHPEGSLQLINTQIFGSTFQLPNMTLRDFEVDLNGSFPWDNFKKFQGEIQGSGSHLQYLQFNFDDLKSYFNINEESITYKVEGSGNTAVRSSGEIIRGQEGWKLNLRQLSGNLYHHPYNLLAETSLDIKKEELSFTPVLMKIGMGQIYISEDKPASSLILKLNRFPIESLEFLIPKLEIEGEVDLDAQFENIFSKTHGNLKANFRHLQLGEDARREIYDGEVVATFDKDDFKGSVILKQNKQNLGNFTFDLPLSFSLYPLNYKLSYEKTSHMELKYNGWVNPLIQLVLPPNHILEGFASADLKLKGPLKEPNVTGFLNLHKGYYENLFLGLVLNDIELESDANKRYLILKKFTSHDGSTGKVAANGKLELNLNKKLPYEVNLKLINGQIIQFDFLSATFFGGVSLKGDLKKAYLTGSVQITAAEVNIPTSLGKGLPKLEVSYLYPRQEQPCQNKRESKYPIFFDLHVDVLNNTVIKGRGLDSSWAGKIDIKGTDSQPLFKGKLASQEGSFNFAGRFFILREGSIHFNGLLGKETSINLIANDQIDNYLITANLKGPLLAPYLTFRSSPGLEKREIISLVLFGQKVDSLNAFQGVSLTYTLASLSDIYEGPDVIDRLRKGIGLDQLSFGSLASGDKNTTTIQVGKYITRGILITLNRPISADPAPFIITAYFRGGFQFQTYFDEQQISKLQIQWRLSY